MFCAHAFGDFDDQCFVDHGELLGSILHAHFELRIHPLEEELVVAALGEMPDGEPHGKDTECAIGNRYPQRNIMRVFAHEPRDDDQDGDGAGDDRWIPLLRREE